MWMQQGFPCLLSEKNTERAQRPVHVCVCLCVCLCMLLANTTSQDVALGLRRHWLEYGGSFSAFSDSLDSHCWQKAADTLAKLDLLNALLNWRPHLSVCLENFLKSHHYMSADCRFLCNRKAPNDRLFWSRKRHWGPCTVNSTGMILIPTGREDLMILRGEKSLSCECSDSDVEGRNGNMRQRRVQNRPPSCQRWGRELLHTVSWLPSCMWWQRE